jgi:hypothetical protein
MSTAASSVSLAMLPSEETIKAQAELAFTDTNTADAKKSTAEQRMAYVVQCTISNLHANGKKDLKLDFAFGNKEHKATVVSRMVKAYAGAKPDQKKLPVNVFTREDAAYKIRRGLVVRGTWIAIVLAHKGVVYTNFNVKSGIYTVPTSIMVPKDCSPLGRLAKEDRIPLDRSPIACLSKAQLLVSGQSCVKHLLDCVVPKLAKGKDKGKQEAGKETATEKQVLFGKATATELATGSSLSVLITAVHQLFVKDAGKGQGALRHCDMPQTWNLLSDIMRKYDEHKNHADWMTPRDVKDAEDRIQSEFKPKGRKPKVA